MTPVPHTSNKPESELDYEQMWRDCHARNSTLWQELNGWEAEARKYRRVLGRIGYHNLANGQAMDLARKALER